MVGHNTATSDLASRWCSAQPRSVIWTNGRWIPLRPGAGYQQSGYGPEITLAHELATRLPDGDELGIVKVAEPGTSLNHHWNPENRGQLFDSLVEQTRAAMQSGPVRLWGLLWLQGEADSADTDSAQAYADNYQKFIHKLRACLGAPGLPVITGLVNLNTETHPHSERVRHALRHCQLPATQFTSCADLELHNDGKHLTPKSLGKLARRFAYKLSEAANPTELAVRRWLWSGENYHAWYEGPVACPDNAVVSFPYAEKGDASEMPPFGQQNFSKAKTPTVYIRFRTADWFQSYEAFDLSWAIRKGLGQECNLVTYGVSMGGYGALLLSGPLKAKKVIAIAPQFTIDRAVFPWEHRWSWAAKYIGHFIHNIDACISPTAEKHIFFDGLSADRRHVAAFKTDQSWHLTNLPNASHQIMRFLKETGTLTTLMQDWFVDGPPVKLLHKQTRQARRSSQIYLLTRAKTSGPRWPSVANQALDLCEAIGGPKARIATKREQLAKLHNSKPASENLKN